MKDTYMVRITATDASGATDTIDVTINITDADDDAVITGPEMVDYPENGTDAVASYSATDEDGDAIVWSVDNDTFEISEDGELTFASPPDFETEDGSSHTVSGQGNRRYKRGDRHDRKHERGWVGELEQAAAAGRQRLDGHFRGPGRRH